MDRIAKQLEKFSPKERARVKKLLLAIKSGQLSGIDIKKLKGFNDIFRARLGSIRVIFHRTDLGIKLLSLGRRNDHTYDGV